MYVPATLNPREESCWLRASCFISFFFLFFLTAVKCSMCLRRETRPVSSLAFVCFKGLLLKVAFATEILMLCYTRLCCAVVRPHLTARASNTKTSGSYVPWMHTARSSENSRLLWPLLPKHRSGPWEYDSLLYVCNHARLWGKLLYTLVLEMSIFLLQWNGSIQPWCSVNSARDNVWNSWSAAPSYYFT